MWLPTFIYHKLCFYPLHYTLIVLFYKLYKLIRNLIKLLIQKRIKKLIPLYILCLCNCQLFRWTYISKLIIIHIHRPNRLQLIRLQRYQLMTLTLYYMIFSYILHLIILIYPRLIIHLLSNNFPPLIKHMTIILILINIYNKIF